MKIILVILSCLLSLHSFSAYTGITFSEDEKRIHLSNIDTLTKTAGDCLQDTYNEHLNFHRKYGVSKFYGNRKYTKGWDKKLVVQNGKKKYLLPIKAELKKRGLDPELENSMENMSCVDFARKCLKKGFDAAGLSHQWKKIDSFIPDKIGNRLQHALQALGWQIAYWNPNPSKNRDWDLDDRKSAPGNPLNVWGQNEAHYNSVMNNNRYYLNIVDDKRTLVGFQTNPPRIIDDVEMAVGTANTGYHVFLVSRGSAIEAHSTRDISAQDNLEFNPFNPLKEGGGPIWTQTEKYRTGIMAIPPRK